MSRVRIVIAMLFCAALLVPTSTAQASSYVLCTGYSSCSDKGYRNYGYEIHKSTSYWRMYTGTNCTNYVAFRLVTTNGMPNVRPKSSVGNAQDWGFAMSSITNSTPALGSVAWWGRTGHHVAYVEKIVSSSEIWVSESNWSGSFDWRKITKSGSGWPDGFIHFKDLKLTNTTKPTVSGTVKVGGTVTASPGSWTPSATYRYRWLLDGAAITGATSKSYVPTAAQQGHQLSVRVTASRTSYPSTNAYSAKTVVAPGKLTATKLPSISGEARVDTKLTGVNGSWTPTGATYAYQWLASGVPIPGMTDPTFTPGPEFAGKHIRFRVTATKPGYTPVSATSEPTVPLAPGLLVATTKPTITGTARMDSTLTATKGIWSKPDLTYAYQWFADGQAIDGAVEPTHKLTAADVGRAVTVVVTASKAGYETTAATSLATASVAHGTQVMSARPSISGTARVGVKLTASPGAWSPGGSYAYQWYAGQDPIAGATAQTYVPGAAERGKQLHVSVKVLRPGYTTARHWSTNTAPVEIGRVALAEPPHISGSARLGSTLTAVLPKYYPLKATVRYQWFRDGKAITGATAQTRTLTKYDLGSRLTVRVTFSAPAYTTRVVMTDPTARVKATPTVTVKATPGTRKVSFTVMVTAPEFPAPGGSVTVYLPSGNQRTYALASGKVTISLSYQPSGAQTYRFRYGGTSLIAARATTSDVTIG